MSERDYIGIAVYLTASFILGMAAGTLLLAVHEDNDRCHYYGGRWSVPDIVRGLLAVTVGGALRYLILKDVCIW